MRDSLKTTRSLRKRGASSQSIASPSRSLLGDLAARALRGPSCALSFLACCCLLAVVVVVVVPFFFFFFFFVRLLCFVSGAMPLLSFFLFFGAKPLTFEVASERVRGVSAGA